MKPHKWAKEIKAWADGAEIEARSKDTYLHLGYPKEWVSCEVPAWWEDYWEFRIKPQPKEPQYLYVYWGNDCSNGYHYFVSVEGLKGYKYIGKIKLEQDE